MASKPILFLILFGVLLVLLVLARPLLPIDETRYLAVAWEMHLSGDPFHLTRNFEAYAHKPPLLFWLINLVWMVTGVSEISARLVGPVCALGVVAATGMLAQRLWPERGGIALHAMVATATFPVFMIFASATMFDALLTLPVLGGIALIWRIGQGRTDARHWLVLGGVVGIGMLAKGPVILVHLVPVLVAMRIWAAVPPARSEVARGAGIATLMAAAVIALWLVPALAIGDEGFRRELLWTQTAARLSGDLGHGRPVWFLLGLVPLIVFPWGWSLPLWRGLPGMFRADRSVRLCVIWAVGGLAVFSVIGGKQLHYLLPEIPALGLIVARGFDVFWSRRGGLLPAIALGALGLVPAGAAFRGTVVPIDSTAGLVPTLSAALAASLVGLATLGLALPSARAHAAMGFGLPLVLHAGLVFGGLNAQLDTAPIAGTIASRLDGGVAVFGIPDNAEFNFKARLTQHLEIFGEAKELDAWCRDHPDGWVLGPVGDNGMAVPARQTWVYRGRVLGIWAASDLDRSTGEEVQRLPGS
jgi:4-amino-4-deoxy-L-arabinose transferase-like glycosyltransferase